MYTVIDWVRLPHHLRWAGSGALQKMLEPPEYVMMEKVAAVDSVVVYASSYVQELWVELDSVGWGWLFVNQLL